MVTGTVITIIVYSLQLDLKDSPLVLIFCMAAGAATVCYDDNGATYVIIDRFPRVHGHIIL